ncbi:DUF6510 family protein [Nonomuraea terrae]|uniref:DUF6510 family protein n=1 Tax=Nonomuraea terrae TaxID=2530383 RepID=UPI00378C2C5A
MSTNDDHLDANAAGGALRELFSVDLTAAGILCATCARSFTFAEALLYARAPGLVGRCPACGEVVFRLVRGPGRAWLDLRGSTCLAIRMPEGR